MQMSVSPKEIAKHLVDELGHKEAVKTYKYHLSRCTDEKTANIWNNIGTAITSLKPGEQRS